MKEVSVRFIVSKHENYLGAYLFTLRKPGQKIMSSTSFDKCLTRARRYKDTQLTMDVQLKVAPYIEGFDDLHMTSFKVSTDKDIRAEVSKINDRVSNYLWETYQASHSPEMVESFPDRGLREYDPRDVLAVLHCESIFSKRDLQRIIDPKLGLQSEYPFIREFARSIKEGW